MSIQAVIFDFGGVLYKTPDIRWLIRFQSLFGAPKDEVLWGLYLSPSESPYVKDVMSGKIPESDLWDALAIKLRVRKHWLHQMRNRSLTPRRLNLPMINLLKQLRTHYRTAILTNAASEFRSTFCQAFGMEQWADQVIISAETGMAKPDPLIYHYALQQMGVEAGQALFMDDIAENVDAARQVGMHAVHFRSNRQALLQINSILASIA